MTETHSKYSPSSLPFRSLCCGWQSDPTPGPMAMRGTAIHGILAGLVPTMVEVVNFPTEHAEPVNAGLAIMAELRRRFPDHQWATEIKLDTGIPEVYGTGDVVGVSEWSPVGVVIDWKTGRGDRDDAGTSLQTAAYALGLLRLYPHLQEVLVVMGEIEQTPTEATWSREALEAAEARIRYIVAHCDECADIPAEYNPQPKSCQYCARRTHCPALARSVGEVAATIPRVEDVRELSGMELASALKRYQPAAKLVEQFIGALEDRAKEILAAGGEVPGFALKESNGARAWTAPEDVVRAELASTGVDLTALVSPTEAEKRLAEKIGGKGAKKAAADAIKGLCKAAVRKSLVEA
jgi:Protein of unknown function (DUF2800)